MQRTALEWRRNGQAIGFVPTMGYLHDGHLSLVRRARKIVGPNGKVVVSIYVNPTQFGPKEDLSRYPRDLKNDLKLCKTEGADAVFVPTNSSMYPKNAEEHYSTYVLEESLSTVMEGASRPTHFRGVTTIVAKLFNIVQPTVAVFGEKDFQQSAVITRMVKDLNMSVRIVVSPTGRERDGLAMSSRNKYLSAEERKQAVVLKRSIDLARKIIKQENVGSARLKQRVRSLIRKHSLAKLDYVEVFDERTLQPVKKAGRGNRIALAVFFGKTRLIDSGRL